MSAKLTGMLVGCLLRGARQRLAQLEDDLRELKGRGDTSKDVTTPLISALEAEVACLNAAIEWVWRHRDEYSS